MFAIFWSFCRRLLETWNYFGLINVVWLLASINSAVPSHLVESSTLNVAIPMSTIAILLILITVLSYLSIWVSTRRNQLHNSTNRSLAQNRKLAKTLFIVRILSLITWLPAGISMKLLKGFKFTSLANHACLTVRQFLSEPNSVQLQNGRIQEVVETLFCRCYSRELIRDAIPVSVSQEISLTYFKSVD